MSQHRHRRRRSGWLTRRLRRFKWFRIFQEDRAFRYAFVAGLGFVGLLLLAIPRVIRTTPPDFPLGEVQVSLVDLTQAWSLARSARQAERDGDPDSAIQAWRSAVANNPGDIALYRGSLRCLLVHPKAAATDAIFAGQAATWAAALSGGRGDDLILAANVLEKFSQPHRALEVLAEVPPGTSDAVDRARARSLFSSGQFESFEQLAKDHQDAWASDPAMVPYFSAWKMIRDDRSTGLESGLQLKEEASKKGWEGLRAARLLHQVGVRRGWVDEAGTALQRLVEGRAATVMHHVQYWRLLVGTGRAEEARALARVFKEAPRDAAPAQMLVETMKELGLRAEALRFLEMSIESYGTAVAVWRIYFDLLLEAERWNEVRRLTAGARVLCSRNDALYGETLFADYRAALGMGRTNDAALVVRDLVDLRSPDPNGVVRAVGRLREDGRASQSLAILRNHETAFAGSGVFWSEYFQVGRVLKDVSLLRRAVSELTRLQPKSTLWAGNRAALLLITGENPSEALQLTFEVLQKQPDAVAARINHAIALFMNGRVNEASTHLRSVDPSRLVADASDSYYLLLGEIRASEGRADEARQAVARVERERLFPHQLERLEAVLGKAAPGTRTPGTG